MTQAGKADPPANAASGTSTAMVPLGVGVAVLAISSAAPVIRLAAPLGPEVIACLRVSVSALVLALITHRATARALRLLASSRRDALWTILAGLCLAAHFGAWIASLSLTTVVRSVALVSTTPLFAGLFARALGDRAPLRLYVGTAVAIAGTLIMVEPGAASSEQAWLGDLLALSGAVTAALYLAIGRKVHAQLGDALPVEGYFVCVNMVAAVALWIFALTRGAELAPLGVTQTDYLAVLWLGLAPGIVGHGLLNWAVRRVPVHVVSLAALLEPAGAGLLAWGVLAEVPAAREILGAVLLIVGVSVGAWRRS
ncbi:Permease of the drug/metabolite transporter (DMT) superfamily protein [Enhygromyxa salina]|uniref:Permease of the drug/metabolite transporter (DMT) superfamily protein n=1 Tax=Enhygromyxa salina TaxID=215803 RepID=A0A0C1ZM53_9BACT|nr:DMT family transporter [Enhygromyxa salina]KIG11988.1 Permease of the drug/metabolite transporter (DMT) superfamily protein [Enhygromyxa salina]